MRIFLSVAMLLSSSIVAESYTLQPSFVMQKWQMIEPQGKIENLTQISNSIGGKLELSEKIAVSFRQSFLQMEDDTLTLKGFSDTKFSLSYTEREKWKVSLGISLPIGRNILSSEEIELTDKFYRELFGFSAYRLGESFDIDFSATKIYSLRSFIFSGGFSYLHRSSYKIFQNSPPYSAGDRAKIIFASLWSRNRLSWRNEFDYTNYTADRVGDRIISEQASEFQIGSAVLFEGKRTNFGIRYDEIFRSGGQYLSRDLLPNRNFRKITISIAYVMGPTVRISAELAHKFTEADKLGFGGSELLEPSIGLNFQASDKLDFHLSGKFPRGNMNSGAVELKSTVILVTGVWTN